MSETNPYEAPRAEVLRPLPRRSRWARIESDQVLATRLLAIRRGGGYVTRVILRLNAKRYLGAAMITLGLLIFCASLEAWTAFAALLVFTAGRFVRDLEWIQAIGRGWPFTEKVTDWEKVAALADADADADA